MVKQSGIKRSKPDDLVVPSVMAPKTAGSTSTYCVASVTNPPMHSAWPPSDPLNIYAVFGVHCDTSESESRTFGFSLEVYDDDQNLVMLRTIAFMYPPGRFDTYTLDFDIEPGDDRRYVAIATGLLYDKTRKAWTIMSQSKVYFRSVPPVAEF